MNKLAKCFATSLVLGTLTSPAIADSFYGALDFGQTTAKDACSIAGLPAGTTVTGCKDTATMYRVAGGYQFAPMWGAEVSYGTYGKASLGIVNIPGTGSLAAGDWQSTGLQVSATGSFPVGDAFALTGKIGIARTDLKISATSLTASTTNLGYGIGAQYSVSKSIALRVQYEDLGTVGDASSTGTAKMTLLSGGVILKF